MNEARMKAFPETLAAVLVAVPAYVIGWFLWLAGRWSVILPPAARPHDLWTTMLPPLTLPVVYFAWLAARRRRNPAGNSRKRLIQFGLAAAISVVTAAVHMLLTDTAGRSAYLPAMVAFVLMIAVALLSLAIDRDVELSLRIVLFTILAVVPAVVAGRLLAIGGAMTLFYALRTFHQIAS